MRDLHYSCQPPCHQQPAFIPQRKCKFLKMLFSRPVTWPLPALKPEKLSTPDEAHSAEDLFCLDGKRCIPVLFRILLRLIRHRIMFVRHTLPQPYFHGILEARRRLGS
ncbi:hypothetical protein E2C01_018866 [Portunus trituberculatus]|uniref:Uncharacterized protein n=1 Tax=Portunus trituberculatus TaxID=210409 RepID=A0A5B7DY86_PORTR|nr:hypothetical protein [Portunus trituberculatus]